MMRVTIKEYSFITLNCSLVCAPISMSAACNCSSIQFFGKGTDIARSIALVGWSLLAMSRRSNSIQRKLGGEELSIHLSGQSHTHGEKTRSLVFCVVIISLRIKYVNRRDADVQ